MTNSNDKPKHPQPANNEVGEHVKYAMQNLSRRRKITKKFLDNLDRNTSIANAVTEDNYHARSGFRYSVSEKVLDAVQTALSAAEASGHSIYYWSILEDGSLWICISDDNTPRKDRKFKRICRIPIEPFFPQEMLEEMLNSVDASSFAGSERVCPRWGTVEEVKDFRARLKEVL